MFSLNVPVPGRLRRLADELAPVLAPLGTVVDRPTLVLKRLGDRPDPGLEKRARRVLAGAAPFEAAATRLDAFEDPPSGPAPVVYLAIEAPELGRLHADLCEAFEPATGIEADDYVPHVTLARGGDPDDVRRALGTAVEPVRWRVEALVFYDGRYREPVGRLPLPPPR